MKQYKVLGAPVLKYSGKQAKQLGQSGDSVDFVFEQNSIFVKKTAGKQNSRLELQCLKQTNFPKISGFEVPKLIHPWNGSSFVMEYVPGIPLGGFLRTASTQECLGLSEKLQTYFGYLFEHSKLNRECLGSNVAFVNKFQEMKHKVHLDALPIIFLAVQQLSIWADEVKDYSGPNHGDFSFENILVHPTTADIWLIDMLNSPFESPLIDVGRVLLDSEHGWWQSGNARNATEIIAGQTLSRAIRKICYEHGVTDLEIAFFKCFAALRVLPYTTKTIRRSILVNAIEEVIITNEKKT